MGKEKNQRTKSHFVRGRAQNKVCALVTKEMTIREIIERYPKAIPVFLDYGLYCFGCPIAQVETIEEMARAYQFDLEKILEDLNNAAKEK